MKTENKTSNKEITKDMTFAEILKRNPDSAEVLFKSGMHCIGCGAAMYETLEQGGWAHGMNKKEIDELIKKINNKTTK